MRYGITIACTLALMLGHNSVNASDYSVTDNRRVAAFVLEASGIAYAPSDSAEVLKQKIATRMTKSTTSNVFRKLQGCRTTEKYQSNPKDIVGAEHYAFMRSLASESGDTELKELPTLYYVTKLKLKSEGKLQWLRTTDQLVSDPTLGAKEWGELGVVHGLQDYLEETGKTPAPGETAKGLQSDLEKASSHPIYSWINRHVIGNPYTALKNSDCHVSAPTLE